MKKRVRFFLLGALLLVAAGLALWIAATPEVPERRPLTASAPPDEEPAERPPLLTGRPPLNVPADARAEAPTPGDPDEEEAAGHYVVEGRVLQGDKGIPLPDVTVVGWCSTAEPVPGLPNSRWMKTHTWSGDADPEGRFRIVVDGTPLLGLAGFRLEEAGLRVERWTLADGTTPRWIQAKPGAIYEVVLHVAATFRLRGVVVDDAGGLLAGVKVMWSVPVRPKAGELHLGGQRLTTSDDGSFDVGDFPVKSPLSAAQSTSTMLYMSFLHPDLCTVGLDPWSVSESERDHLRIVMDGGATLAGVLLDARGQPLPDVVVDMEYGNDHMHRRATRTDEDGSWRLDRLSRGKARLLARAFAHGAKARRELEVSNDDLDVTLVAEPVPRPADEQIVRALGMQLVDVDAALRTAYELSDYVKVLILDPGSDPARLDIGRLEPGYGLYMVGETRIESVKEAVDLLCRLTSDSPEVRVVYTFANERMHGTNTQYARLTAEDMAALKSLREALAEELEDNGR